MEAINFGRHAIRKLIEERIRQAGIAMQMHPDDDVLSLEERVAYSLVPTGCICDERPGYWCGKWYCAWCDAYEIAREMSN